MSLFYPGEDFTKTMFNLISDSALAGLFNAGNLESPGWILWVSFVFSLCLYFFLAISGINIGVKIVPTVESDCIEMVNSNSSYSARKLYMWNYFAAILSLSLIIIPIFII